MVVILTIFSIVAMLAGTCGICGVYQYSKSALTGFWVCLLVCLIGFCAAGAIAIAIPLSFQNEGCLSTTYPGIGYIQNQTTLATTRFCRAAPLNCTCFINTNTSYYNTLNGLSLSHLNNYTLPISVFDCSTWIVGSYDTMLAAF